MSKMHPLSNVVNKPESNEPVSCELCRDSGSVFVNGESVECPVCLRKKFNEQEELLNRVKESWSSAATDITDLEFWLLESFEKLPPVVGEDDVNKTINMYGYITLIRRAALTIKNLQGKHE